MFLAVTGWLYVLCWSLEKADLFWLSKHKDIDLADTWRVTCSEKKNIFLESQSLRDNGLIFFFFLKTSYATSFL